MNITFHTDGHLNPMLARMISEAVARKPTTSHVKFSPLADPLIEGDHDATPPPRRFLANFYEWAAARRGYAVETAIELGPLDKPVLPDIKGVASFVVDKRTDAIERVRARYPFVTAIQADIATLTGEYDIVAWNREMLHFLGMYANEPEPYESELLKVGGPLTAVDQTLRQIYQIVKPGGYFVETIPMRDSWGLPLRLEKNNIPIDNLNYVLVNDSLIAMFFKKAI